MSVEEKSGLVISVILSSTQLLQTSSKAWKGHTNLQNSRYKPVIKSTNLVEILSLDGGAYLRYSSNITPSYKNLQFW
jgi:hypothetical protein